MNDTLFVEGKEFILATKAAKLFEYSNDYILLLAKQEKVIGRKINNRWYVYLPSIESFFDQSKKQNELRRAALRVERKKELKEFTPVDQSEHKKIAILETAGVMTLGLLVGAIVYFGDVVTYSFTQHKSLENLAMSMYALVRGSDMSASVVPASVATLTPATTAEVSLKTTTVVESIVVIKDDDRAQATIEELKDSFSDPVHVQVDPNDPKTGIVTPRFKDTDGEAYRFLMVPVTLTDAS